VSSDRWRRIASILDLAQGLDPDARARLLDETCDDPDLRTEVESLLEYASTGASFLRTGGAHALPKSLLPADLTAVPTAVPLPSGRLGHRYRVLRRLGRGGMGTVFEAADERFGRTAAVKATSIASPYHLYALESEARLLSVLRHPSLPAVSDWFTEDGFCCVVMDYVPGLTLGELLRSRLATVARPFEPSLVLLWADQLLDALDFLHSHTPPIVHRDVKPDNLKLTPLGQVVLLDFGLAKGSAGPWPSEPANEELRGFTPCYASLEQMRGLGTDPRSDLYSLGATCYEFLTGRRPEDAVERALARLAGRPDPCPPAHEIEEGVGPFVASVVERAMSLDPDDRPASAAAMRLDLAFAAQCRPTGALAGGRRAQAAPRPPRISSVAILDFASTTESSRAIARTLTEALAGALAACHEIRVLSPAAAGAVRAASDPASVGRQLGVDAVVVGRVVEIGERVLAEARLLASADGWHLWGSHANHVARDFDLLVRRLADALRDFLVGELGHEMRARRSSRHTLDARARDHYLKSRSHLAGRAPSDLRMGIRRAELAAEIDADFAPAQATLAEGLAVLATYGLDHPRVLLARAERAVRRALSIDPDLADAHAALGLTLLQVCDVAGAERSLLRAVELVGDDARYRQWLVFCHLAAGRLDRAVDEARRAVELDASSTMARANLAWALYFRRDFAEAIDECHRAITLDVTFWRGYWTMGRSLLLLGRIEEASRQLARGFVFVEHPALLSVRAAAAARMGDLEEAISLFDALSASNAEGYLSPYFLAEAYAGFGDHAAALACLRRAYEDQMWLVTQLAIEPYFDGLRREPGFRELVESIARGPFTVGLGG
jgi:tetratricopeptide (TPR) repeat protein